MYVYVSIRYSTAFELNNVFHYHFYFPLPITSELKQKLKNSLKPQKDTKMARRNLNYLSTETSEVVYVAHSAVCSSTVHIFHKTFLPAMSQTSF